MTRSILRSRSAGRIPRLAIVASAVALAFAGCGGGGGSDDASVASTTVGPEETGTTGPTTEGSSSTTEGSSSTTEDEAGVEPSGEPSEEASEQLCDVVNTTGLTSPEVVDLVPAALQDAVRSWIDDYQASVTDGDTDFPSPPFELVMLVESCPPAFGAEGATDRPTFTFLRVEGAAPDIVFVVRGTCPGGSAPADVAAIDFVGDAVAATADGDEFSIPITLPGIDDIAELADPAVLDGVLAEVGIPEGVVGTCA